MLFSQDPRCLYARPAAHEVICQLRFPTILSIENHEPADFQEEIRSIFPLYSPRREEGAPTIVRRGSNAAPELQTAPSTMNYAFLSEQHLWKLNLTRSFISLSTLRYTQWEKFAAQLDLALASFIRVYQPAFFERIGLRYRNIISRSALELEDHEWRDLIAAPYLGALAESDVRSTMVRRAATDLELQLSESCFAKIHAEPAHMKHPNAAQPEEEEKFLLDIDLSMRGKISAPLAAGALETLHAHSTPLFRGAITDTLHDALTPVVLDL